MRTPRLWLPLGLFLLAAVLAPSRADGPDWFPFVIPWDDSGPGVTSVAALNPTPAGGRGFLASRDGHFYDEKGNRARFLGVNFCFNACFPDKADTAKVAAKLHKYGINIVRLHLMDFGHAPRGIFDPRFKDRQHLDAGQLDRLDYLVAQLKRQGVYVNINLHVARSLGTADGFPDADRLPGGGAVVTYFEPRMVELQKNYARDLLTHYNPYTKTRYAAEPAVAVVELANENTLVGQAWNDTLDKLPPHYRKELTRQWNAWLKDRYGDTAALRKAWKLGAAAGEADLIRNGDFSAGTASWGLERHEGARAEAQTPAGASLPDGVRGRALRLQVMRSGKQGWHIQFLQTGLDLGEGEVYTLSFWARADRKRGLGCSTSLDQGDYRGVGLADGVMLTPEWQRFERTFTARRTVPKHTRLVFSLGVGGEGAVELAGVSLRPGAKDTLPKGATVEAGTMPQGRLHKSPAGQDWVAFLIDTERRYVDTMTEYVKKTLKSRANVVCSQVSWGGLGGAFRERRSDLADGHAYWQHPRFPRRHWDREGWFIHNTPMVRDPHGGVLAHLARYRLAGLPFTVSEYNHPAPSDYRAECMPLVFAFAALQDWDGVYLFDYNGDRASWKDDKIRGFFNVDSNPTVTAFLPAAANLFLRGDIPAAAGESQLRIPEGSVPESMVLRGQNVEPCWEEAKAPWSEILTRRLSVAFVPGKGPVTVRRTEGPKDAGPSPIRWQGANSNQALFTADSPRSKVMVGYLGGRKVELPGWQVEMAKTDSSFAALTLTAMDGKPINQSRSLLLTAVGRVENKGMGWNAKRTSVGKDWGTGPTRAEGIPASVTIDTQGKTATVHALDGSGRRQRQVEATLRDGRLTFRIGPASRTLWYEVEIAAGK
jgi:hypothetical protein